MKTTAILLALITLCAIPSLGQNTKKKTIEIVGRASTIVTADQIVYQVAFLEKDPYLTPDESADPNCDTLASRSAEAPEIDAEALLMTILDSPGIEATVLEQRNYSVNPFEYHEDDKESVLLEVEGLTSLRLLVEQLRQYPYFIGRIKKLGYSRPEAIQKALKVEAVENARENACAMLAAAGSKLGKVMAIVDHRSGKETSSDSWYESIYELYENGSSASLIVVEEVVVTFSIK